MDAFASETTRGTQHAWWTASRLDTLTILASAWLLAGLHLDGWAHAHRPGLESFFTPWHGALYSGFFALAAVTLVSWRVRGDAASRLGALGVAVFLVGGAGDLAWHTLLGIEVSIEALLSPTHMLLAIGMFLMVATPLVRAWRDASQTRIRIPALASATLLLAELAFFTQFMQPGGRPWPLAGNDPTSSVFAVQSVTPDFPVFPGGVPSREIAIMLGIGGMLLATVYAVGMASVLARRFTLPLGALALVLGAAALLLGAMRDTLWLAPAWFVGGLAADVALRSPRAPRLVMAAALPLALWSAYFGIVALRGGVWWSVHAWAGAIVVSTLAGLLLGVAFEAHASGKAQVTAPRAPAR